jgi:hypothetical protein
MKRASDLVYFTHEVEGRLYGGWYRPVGGSAVEVYARGQIRKAKLGKVDAPQRACRMLEEIVRTVEANGAQVSPD